jgi:hypothetical protein
LKILKIENSKNRIVQFFFSFPGILIHYVEKKLKEPLNEIGRAEVKRFTEESLWSAVKQDEIDGGKKPKKFTLLK